jgi:hypothetical protein
MEANTTAATQETARAKVTGMSVTESAKGTVTGKATATTSGGVSTHASASATGTSAMRASSSAQAPAHAGATASGHGSASTGVASKAAVHGTSTTAHASLWGSLKASMGAHVGASVKTGVVALKGSLAAKSLVIVGVGLASLVVAAHTGDVSQAQVAVSAVPAWSSGPTIVGHVQALVGGGSSGGAGLHIVL